MNSRFLTLMQREWLQHRMGWLVLMFAPAIVLLALSFFEGSVRISIGGASMPLNGVDAEGQITNLHQMPALFQTSLLTLVAGTVTFGLALLSVLIQLPGLARRDQQDRSIEFWRGLPVSDAQSVAATLFTHLLALPWVAMLVGLGSGLLATVVIVGLQQGPLAWLTQPWDLLLPALMMLVLRITLGLVLAVVWMSPLLLGTMLASAALRRWGVPALGIALLAGAKLLDPQLPVPMVQVALQTMSSEALRALGDVAGMSPLGEQGGHGLPALEAELGAMPAALWHSGLGLLSHAASPGFVLAFAVGAACFAALVWLRQRSV